MNKISGKVLVLGVVGALVVVGLGYGGYRLWQKNHYVTKTEEKQSTTSTIPSSTINNLQTNIKFTDEFLSYSKGKNSTQGHLFYFETTTVDSLQSIFFNKIIMTDKYGQKITSVVKCNSGHVATIQVINQDSLGVFIDPEKWVDEVNGKRRFFYYSVNLNTLEIKEFQVESQNPPDIGWLDENNFLYFLQTQKEDDFTYQYKLYSITHGQEAEILFNFSNGKADITSPLVTFNIFTSPDKNKLLFRASPGSVGYYSPFRHAVYIYDRKTESIQEVDFEVPQEKPRLGELPEIGWIGNDQVFIYIPGIVSAIYDKNLEVMEELIIPSSEIPTIIGHLPSFNSNSGKVAYVPDSELGEVWVFDLTTRNNEKILEGYTQPRWISNYELLVEKTQPCEENDKRKGCQKPIEGLENWKGVALVETDYYNLETGENAKISTPEDWRGCAFLKY